MEAVNAMLNDHKMVATLWKNTTKAAAKNNGMIALQLYARRALTQGKESCI